MHARTIAVTALLALAIPAAILADPVEEKGFIYASGKLRADPKPDSAETASPPGGARLLYRKVVREGDTVTWYWVDQPGLGSGWLAAAESSKTRTTVLPALKPVPRVTPPPMQELKETPRAARSFFVPATAAKGAKEIEAGKRTAAVRGLSERTMAARTVSASQADELVANAQVDYVTLERLIGRQMSDPPHPDGRYADKAPTADGRTRDAERFKKQLEEGD